MHSAWVTALEQMGLQPLPIDQLGRVIGPPMQLVAHELLAERGRTGDADVEEFVARFRRAIGELEVDQALAYPGITAVLRAVHADHRRLAVVTSKPIQATRRVVPALAIQELFVHLEGPDEDRPEAKTTTLARAVAHLDPDVHDTVLVGDRHHDVEAATDHGIATIGVTWGGFGSEQELRDAGATAVVHSPTELASTLGVRAG